MGPYSVIATIHLSYRSLYYCMICFRRMLKVSYYLNCII